MSTTDRFPELRDGDALIIVDVQNDFLPGGALAVPDGDAVIAPLNRYIKEFERRGLPIFATRDWHPEDHCSFRQQGGIWPPHCVAESPGADWPAALELPRQTHVISKALKPETEAYSGFQGTDLAAQLRKRNCRRVFIGGLATDYCVRATALDALAEGFEVVLLTDAIRPVDVNPGDGARAIEEVCQHGGQLARLAELAA